MIDSENSVAVVLAGGQSRRMEGARKTELTLAGKSLLARVIERIAPQVSEVLLNLNGPVTAMDVSRYAVVPDLVSGFQGPLTGLVSAFRHLAERGDRDRAVLLVPCDGPFLPVDLLEKLSRALNENSADVACVRYGGEMQPTFSLWRWQARETAESLLLDRGQGGFKGLFRELNTVYVDWPDEHPNPFFNINTPDDLRVAEQLVNSL